MKDVWTKFRTLKKEFVKRCELGGHIMKLGKVIGNVVASVKDPGLEGLRLLVIQGLNDNMQPIGHPYVAADGILTAGPGDLVYIVSSKEAAFAISKDDLVPIDACIVGFIDSYNVVKEAKKEKVRIKKKEPVITSKKPKTPLKSQEIKKRASAKRPPAKLKLKPKPGSEPEPRSKSKTQAKASVKPIRRRKT